LLSPQIGSVGVISISVNWPAFAVGSGTGTVEGYKLQASSTNFNGTGTVYSSTTYDVTLSTLTIGNLTPMTTYYLRAGGLNWNNVPNFGAVVSTETLTVPAPTGLAGFAQSASSIEWTWGFNGADNYNLYAFVSPSTTSVIATGVTVLPQAEINLSTNTAYTAVVTAVINGKESALSQPATVYTFAAVPGTPVPTQVSYTSFTVTWSTNSNPGYTPFEVSFSTDSTFGTAVSTPIAFTGFTANTTNLFNLLPGTTYFVRVRAQNGDGFNTLFSSTGSAVTLPVPIPTGLSANVMGTSSITWNWNTVPGASLYNLYEATAPAIPFISTPTPGFLETGLSTNTLYGMTVTDVINGVESPKSAPVSSYTFAAQPGQPGFTTVLYTSFTVTWPSNGNPNNTVYEISESLDGFLTNFSTPIAFGAAFTANTTNFANLLPGTTYWLRVRAENGDGVITSFSTIGATETLPTPAPTGLTGVALGISSITWIWNSVPGATQYKVFEASSPATLITTVAVSSYTETNLSTNLPYGNVVAAIVGGVQGPLSAAATTYTLAAVPGQPVASQVFFTSFTVTWATSGNPGKTP
jgi:hypothetical protein